MQQFKTTFFKVIGVIIIVIYMVLFVSKLLSGESLFVANQITFLVGLSFSAIYFAWKKGGWWWAAPIVLAGLGLWLWLAGSLPWLLQLSIVIVLGAIIMDFFGLLPEATKEQ